jgi:hypothetical protein
VLIEDYVHLERPICRSDCHSALLLRSSRSWSHLNPAHRVWPLGRSGGRLIIPIANFRWIDDRAVIVHESAGRHAGLVDMRRPKDVHHALSCDEKIICDNPPVAAPPDGLGAHDRAAVLAAQFSQLRKACGERLRQGMA